MNNSDVMQLTVKLRQRRCQGDERHSNGYHEDDSVACRQPRCRHVGLVFDPSYVQQTVIARNILACTDQKMPAINTQQFLLSPDHPRSRLDDPPASVDYRDDDVTADRHRPAAGEATESTVDSMLCRRLEPAAAVCLSSADIMKTVELALMSGRDDLSITVLQDRGTEVPAQRSKLWLVTQLYSKA